MQGTCLLEQTVEIYGVDYLYQIDNARGRSQSGSLVFRVEGWAREDVKGWLMLGVATSLCDLSWWGPSWHGTAQSLETAPLKSILSPTPLCWFYSLHKGLVNCWDLPEWLSFLNWDLEVSGLDTAFVFGWCCSLCSFRAVKPDFLCHTLTLFGM